MKMFSRSRFLKRAIVALLIVCLTSCGAALADGSKGAIGILMPSLNSELFATYANEIAAYLEAKGYATNIQGFDFDAGQAVTCIENFITDGVIAIVYMNVDNAGDDALKEAMDAGITVLTGGANNEHFDIHLTVNDYETGRLVGEMAADYINKNFDGKAQVAYITSSRSQNNLNRVNGYKEAMKELCPNAEVVYEAECIDIGSGSAFAENLNTLYPDCKVILTYSDSFAKEVSEVWNALGYPKDAAVFGHDAETAVLADIAAGGYIKGTIAMGDPGEGFGGPLLDYMAGKYEPHTTVTSTGSAVTPANVSEYYQP